MHSPDHMCIFLVFEDRLSIVMVMGGTGGAAVVLSAAARVAAIKIV